MGGESPSPEALEAYYRRRELSLAELSPDEIKAFRKAVGLSQVGLANALGCSRRNVEAWEAGINKAPTHLRLAFAAINAQIPPWSAQTGDAT